ncbi:MAG: hypothetical protein QOD63_1543, partial [Actinomycetota bacterium]|nr:hypothetical protein [Actinomycetota bacterium]
HLPVVDPSALQSRLKQCSGQLRSVAGRHSSPAGTCPFERHSPVGSATRLPQQPVLGLGSEDERRVCAVRGRKMLDRSFTEPHDRDLACLGPDAKCRPADRHRHEFAHNLVKLRQRSVVAAVADHAWRQNDLGVAQGLREDVLTRAERPVSASAEQTTSSLGRAAQIRLVAKTRLSPRCPLPQFSRALTHPNPKLLGEAAEPWRFHRHELATLGPGRAVRPSSGHPVSRNAALVAAPPVSRNAGSRGRGPGGGAVSRWPSRRPSRCP